mmetsp:Transcript_5721/g.15231  ORF Transcript_5721/g.15231 Transcript_5721/m.15231 type:complete len:125 (-) Transcript_5721:739-1113(-)
MLTRPPNERLACVRPSHQRGRRAPPPTVIGGPPHPHNLVRYDAPECARTPRRMHARQRELHLMPSGMGMLDTLIPTDEQAQQRIGCMQTPRHTRAMADDAPIPRDGCPIPYTDRYSILRKQEVP